MQLPHREQWNERGGRHMRHVRQYFSCIELALLVAGSVMIWLYSWGRLEGCWCLLGVCFLGRQPGVCGCAEDEVRQRVGPEVEEEDCEGLA